MHFNVEDMFEKAKRTAVELSSSRKKGTNNVIYCIREKI